MIQEFSFWGELDWPEVARLYPPFLFPIEMDLRHNLFFLQQLGQLNAVSLSVSSKPAIFKCRREIALRIVGLDYGGGWFLGAPHLVGG